MTRSSLRLCSSVKNQKNVGTTRRRRGTRADIIRVRRARQEPVRGVQPGGCKRVPVTPGWRGCACPTVVAPQQQGQAAPAGQVCAIRCEPPQNRLQALASCNCCFCVLSVLLVCTCSILRNVARGAHRSSTPMGTRRRNNCDCLSNF